MISAFASFRAFSCFDFDSSLSFEALDLDVFTSRFELSVV